MHNFIRIRLAILLAIPVVTSITGCGSTGDHLNFTVAGVEQVAVGKTLDFELERVVHDGTVYRSYKIETYQFQCEPSGAVSIDKQNSKLTVNQSGKIKFWVEATVTPTELQKPYADWETKTLKSNVVSIEVNDS